MTTQHHFVTLACGVLRYRRKRTVWRWRWRHTSKTNASCRLPGSLHVDDVYLLPLWSFACQYVREMVWVLLGLAILVWQCAFMLLVCVWQHSRGSEQRPLRARHTTVHSCDNTMRPRTPARIVCLNSSRHRTALSQIFLYGNIPLSVTGRGSQN